MSIDLQILPGNRSVRRMGVGVGVSVWVGWGRLVLRTVVVAEHWTHLKIIILIILGTIF